MSQACEEHQRVRHCIYSYVHYYHSGKANDVIPGYRQTVHFLVIAIFAVLSLISAPVGGQDLPVDKDDSFEGLYMGGTAGLTGLDSIRGFVDSAYYGKWWDELRGVAPPSATVIYGEDHRVEVFTVTDSNLIRLAHATCLIVYDYEVSDNGDGTYSLDYVPWTTQSGYPVCTDERFIGQPRLGTCSGFLVGEDILVTAGHCISSCGSWKFIFDYVMADSVTPPPAIVSEDNVYTCSEILGQLWQGDLDYCVLRLDRPVVGRSPVPIRRSGLVSDGDSVVVSGHPNLLPMKIAGGAVVQNNNGTTPWFQTNTDTYGGNSGSMVVNIGSWEVEGILVRGAPDFDNNGTCTYSNVVPDYGNVGPGLEFEEVTKSTAFESLVPYLATSTGAVVLTATRFGCIDTVGLEVRDSDLAGTDSLEVLVVAASGDSETVVISETAGGAGTFRGSIETDDGATIGQDGLLQVINEDSILLVYEDADDGSGSPATVQAVASIDCLSPTISNVAVIDSGGTMVTISFETSEPASATVNLGVTCGESVYQGWGGATVSHEITVAGLTPRTVYWFALEVSDGQGNMTTDDNGGGCYQFSTTEQPDYFTRQYTTGHDLDNVSLLFTPDSSLDFYEGCRSRASDVAIDTATGTDLLLSDDAGILVTLTGGEQVRLYGVPYNSFYVCSNGFLIFGNLNVAWLENLEDHFGLAPRVSVWWDDLDPPSGGAVRYRQLADRMVVVWADVHEANKFNSNTFLAELYFDGAIRLTYLNVDALDGIVGLSDGTEMRLDYLASDFSAYDTCAAGPCCVGSRGNVDCSWDDVTDITDLQVLVDHLFLSLKPLCCPEESEFNDSGLIDITDVQLLIDHLFLTLTPLPVCL